jgi:hypothetical protein
MKLAILFGLLGLSLAHVPNIVAGVGPGGTQGMFDRANAASDAQDAAVIAAYKAKKRRRNDDDD